MQKLEGAVAEQRNMEPRRGLSAGAGFGTFVIASIVSSSFSDFLNSSGCKSLATLQAHCRDVAGCCRDLLLQPGIPVDDCVVLLKKCSLQMMIGMPNDRFTICVNTMTSVFHHAFNIISNEFAWCGQNAASWFSCSSPPGARQK